MTPHVDLTVLGGGIVGMSTALALKKKFPRTRILLLEKESAPARHQTGHNSGVIHAGVYYPPGSLKAKFCKQGARATLAFCKRHNIPHRQCGKLLVATTALEMERMGALAERCRENEITIHPLNQAELKKTEPHIQGLGALKVPTTAITDYGAITRKMAQCFQKMGGLIRYNAPVTRIRERENQIKVSGPGHTHTTRYMIACTGLSADRTAALMDIDVDFSILPFRGEYHALPRAWAKRVSHLIYPIPDPALPFLGLHLTPMVDGRITVGPNAVLGFKREGYGRFNFSPRDIWEMARFPGFWKLISRHMKSGAMETLDSLWKPGYLTRVQKYCRAINLEDLTPHPAGIRAQAVKKDGSMVHDFHFVTSPRSLHVCNAPSPAATSAIPIGHHLRDRAIDLFRL